MNSSSIFSISPFVKLTHSDSLLCRCILCIVCMNLMYITLYVSWWIGWFAASGVVAVGFFFAFAHFAEGKKEEKKQFYRTKQLSTDVTEGMMYTSSASLAQQIHGHWQPISCAVHFIFWHNGDRDKHRNTDKLVSPIHFQFSLKSRGKCQFLFFVHSMRTHTQTPNSFHHIIWHNSFFVVVNAVMVFLLLICNTSFTIYV